MSTTHLPILTHWFAEINNQNQNLELFVLLSKRKTIRNTTTFCKIFSLEGKIPTFSKIQLTKLLKHNFLS